MLRWYLIHTKPSREALAQSNLARQGYELYFPRALQTVRRGGRWGQQIVPLFPRYLFLRLNEGLQALNPVRSTWGVAGIVRFGPRYAVVPDDVMLDLRARAEPASGLHRLTCAPGLRHGAAVRVTAGALYGLEGAFERQAGADRVVVLLTLLGQRTSVCVPAEFVSQAM